uniref:Uncharacterized protein n=1 Tax=Romanomermis culicivorax TaxID=13658 RepID=A0A915KD07_ROMCU
MDSIGLVRVFDEVDMQYLGTDRAKSRGNLCITWKDFLSSMGGPMSQGRCGHPNQGSTNMAGFGSCGSAETSILR